MRPRQRREPAFRIDHALQAQGGGAGQRQRHRLAAGAGELVARERGGGPRRRSGRDERYGCSFALKNATTAELNWRWKAARSNPAGSRQASGATFANAGVQGARNAKWPAFGTT